MIILMRKQVARVAKTRVANHMAMKSVKRDDMTPKESPNVIQLLLSTQKSTHCHCPEKWNDRGLKRRGRDDFKSFSSSTYII